MDVRADSHLHSRHSFDSQAPLADQCRAALSRGLGEVCFTEHFSHLWPYGLGGLPAGV